MHVTALLVFLLVHAVWRLHGLNMRPEAAWHRYMYTTLKKEKRKRSSSAAAVSVISFKSDVMYHGGMRKYDVTQTSVTLKGGCCADGSTVTRLTAQTKYRTILWTQTTTWEKTGSNTKHLRCVVSALLHFMRWEKKTKILLSSASLCSVCM